MKSLTEIWFLFRDTTGTIRIDRRSGTRNGTSRGWIREGSDTGLVQLNEDELREVLSYVYGPIDDNSRRGKVKALYSRILNELEELYNSVGK